MVMDYLKSVISDHLEDYIHPNCNYDSFLLLRDHVCYLQSIHNLRYKRIIPVDSVQYENSTSVTKAL